MAGSSAGWWRGHLVPLPIGPGHLPLGVQPMWGLAPTTVLCEPSPSFTLGHAGGDSGGLQRGVAWSSLRRQGREEGDPRPGSAVGLGGSGRASSKQPRLNEELKGICEAPAPTSPGLGHSEMMILPPESFHSRRQSHCLWAGWGMIVTPSNS